MNEPSQHILDVYASGVGSVQLECICGRTHFAPDSIQDEEERVELLTLARSKADRYIPYPGADGVSAATIGGNTIVRDCPCEWLSRFETLIWKERERILQYYRVRRDADAAALARLDTELLGSP